MGQYKRSYLLGDIVSGSEYQLLHGGIGVRGVVGVEVGCALMKLYGGDSHYGIVLYPNSIVIVDEFGPSTTYTWSLRICYSAVGGSTDYSTSSR